MQDFVGLTLPFNPSAGRWDFRRFTPDAVLLLLGPNDFPSPDLGKFQTAYRGMLDLVVTNYAPTVAAGAGLKIISVCGGSINGLDPCEQIQAAVKAFNADLARVHDGFRSFFVTISRDTWQEVCLWDAIFPQN